ncbi:O-methyltransferase [Leptodontidium sp. MPI-SDFR-AT-0119]|nr:O-methyltransferase [Leptodontidium sp. MPI-SDFR-AT-0119]
MASTDDIISKAEAILASAKKFKGDRAERHDLMKQVDLLYLQLEDPMDAMLRQWSFMNMATSLNMMVKLGAFEKMPKEGSITATDLGALINLEPSVIVRLMRILTSTGIIELTGEDTYAHTPKSRAYLDGAAMDFFNLCINMFGCYLTWPDYFKTRTPEELIDLRKTPYTFAYGQEGQTFYEVLTADKDRFNMFNKAMMQQEASLPTLGMFPFTSLKEEVEAEPDRALVVDIGGGRGQSLLLIQKEIAGTFGKGSKMVLQDRPQVLDTIPEELLPGIEKMPYDFYTEQPVKNAHIYFLRRIIHNYQDNVCHTILKIIAAAMSPKSRLLIGEVIVPARTQIGEDLSTYWMDMVMISIGGKERSEKEFVALLEGAGLVLYKIWPYAVGNQAMIEARLKSA